MTKAEGMKFDTGKLRYDLLDPMFEKSVVEVLTYGANKYGPNNWQAVDSERYYAAFKRHFNAWRTGELNDEESGLHHLSHAACNLYFLYWKEQNEGSV